MFHKVCMAQCNLGLCYLDPGVYPSRPALSLQGNGLRLSCSPSSHSAALGGDYRTHSAGTLWHDRDWHGTVQPSQRPTHPRYTSLTDCRIHLYTHTHLYTYTFTQYGRTHTRGNKQKWVKTKPRSRWDQLGLRDVYSNSFTLANNNNAMRPWVSKH